MLTSLQRIPHFSMQPIVYYIVWIDLQIIRTWCFLGPHMAATLNSPLIIRPKYNFGSQCYIIILLARVKGANKVLSSEL